MLHLLYLSLLGGCTSQTTPALPGGETDSSPAGGDDSGEDTSDSGEETTTGEEIVCADPSLRESEGPFERIALSQVVLQDYDVEPDMTLANGVAVGDLDGDGRLDLVVPQSGPGQLLMQQADGSFADETAARWPGAADVPGSAAAHIVDIDGDGHQDVFLCAGMPVNNTDPVSLHDQLFLNDGEGGLVNVSEAWGLHADPWRPCFGAAFGDIDNDGDLDMANAVNEACFFDPLTNSQDCDALLDRDHHQVLWENTGSGFVDITARLPRLEVLSSFMHVVTLLDVDGDGNLDLYLTNDDKRDVEFSARNLLFRGDGEGGFALDEGSHGLNISIAGMGIGVADLNDDALPDMIISGTRQAALLISTDGLGWADYSAARGVVFTDPSQIEAWGTDFVDLDNDGDLDLPFVFGWLTGKTGGVTYHQRDALFLAEEGGTAYAEVATEWAFADDGIGRGLAAVDLDGDGWQDILKRELGGGLILYRARCGEAAWTQISLHQDGSANPDAIGAVVAVTAGGETARRWVLGAGTSFASSAAAGPHFGLGEAERIDKVEVTWPDGVVSTFTDLPVRTPLQLTRP